MRFQYVPDIWPLLDYTKQKKHDKIISNFENRD